MSGKILSAYSLTARNVVLAAYAVLVSSLHTSFEHMTLAIF